MIRYTFDRGYGSSIGRVLNIHLGNGAGYMHNYWVKLNKGPGNAIKPNTPCGHKGIYHCNSAHCTRFACRHLLRLPFIFRGATLRVWLGPTYYSWYHFRNTFNYLRSQKRSDYTHKWLYSLVSFRF